MRAEITLALAAPKRGLGAPRAADLVGRLLLADISVPDAILRRVGATAATSGLFDRTPIVEVATPRG